MRVRHTSRTTTSSTTNSSTSTTSTSDRRSRGRLGPVPAIVVAVAATLSLGSAPAYAEEPAAPAPASTADAGKQVRLVVGTEPARIVTTTATRPVAVARGAGVRVSRLDKVALRRNGDKVRAQSKKRVRDADTVKVIRIKAHVKVARHEIKPRTVTRKTTKLAPGKRKVVAQGRHGVRQVRIVRWTRNSERFDTTVKRRVVKQPAPRRVLVGTKARSVPGTGHLNWGALANCESSGNPRAVNPAGYYGLYQFNVATWRGVGGKGMPHQAAAGEQTHRAKILYSQRGRSPWPNCGRLL
ncbi:resuscitation-promoting factor [Nocardioides pantholopis]|uniref:resuscitation-promoting factor n=1 Tax=Nocardioides pantholopis TaxID=2483798 RepID=UPI000F079FAA|nr:resuscitation-promoting factor [Nocardioides pantholopis]